MATCLRPFNLRASALVRTGTGMALQRAELHANKRK